MNKNQTGFAPILILLIVILIAVVGYFLYARNISNPSAPAENTGYSALQNNEDLNKLSNELDNTNPNQLDPELNQINADTAAF